MSSHQSPPRERELSRSLWIRYGVAVVSVAIATWVRLILDPVLGDRSAFETLLFAVVLTAWYGGFGPAFVAVVFGVLSADYYLVVPRGSFGFKGATQYLELALYLAIGTGVAIIGGVMDGARQKTPEHSS